jgi:hypothetical protein
MAGGTGAQRAQKVRPWGNFNAGVAGSQQQLGATNNSARQQPSSLGDGGFDGPTDSNAPRQTPSGPGLGSNPPKPVEKEPVGPVGPVITNTRVELPAGAYLLNKEVSRSIYSWDIRCPPFIDVVLSPIILPSKSSNI